MKSREFLKEQLFQIFTSIKNISIKYQYLKEKNLHLIEITPFLEQLKNQELTLLLTKLLRDFQTSYWSEQLLFIDENSPENIETPEFSFSRIRGKSIIETRSFKNYSASFTLKVTDDLDQHSNFR